MPYQLSLYCYPIYLILLYILNPKIPMKKVASLGSTRPQQSLTTDYSVSTPLKSIKKTLTTIINYLFKIIKSRDTVFFSVSDTQQLYNSQPLFFNTIFDVDSGNKLWDTICRTSAQRLGDSEQQQNSLKRKIKRGGQLQIISLVIKIIINLTNRKHQCAQNKRIQDFVLLQQSLQWLQGELVNLQKKIRVKKKSIKLTKQESISKKKEQKYRQYQNYIKTLLQHKKEEMIHDMDDKHLSEYLHQMAIQQKSINQHQHIYWPSLQLNQAKDISLLTKLAPYKAQKNRVYEYKCLQKNLYDVAEGAKHKIDDKIETKRIVQKNKIKHRQSLQKQHRLWKADEQMVEVMRKLEKGRQQQRKYEQVQLKNWIKEHNKSSNQRIASLKRSLNRYSMQDQSQKIRSIIHKHRQTIQLVNDINIISKTQKHSKFNVYDRQRGSAPCYTIDNGSKWPTLRAKTKQQKHNTIQSQKKIEKCILDKIRRQQNNQQEREVKRLEGTLRKNRRSLIDLYDKQLKQVNY